MTNAYAVPGVYVTETNGLSLSIQQGETAVPVFVGVFNAKNQKETPAANAPLTCVRVDSWLDFTHNFDPSDRITIDLTQSSPHVQDERFMGSNSVRLYFENGGGPCYVLPVRHNNKKVDVSPAHIALIGPAIAQCPDITLLCWCEYEGSKADQNVYTALGALLGANATPGGNPGRFLLTDAWPTGSSDAPAEWTFTTPDVADKTQVASYFPALLTGYARNYSDYLSRPDWLGYEHLVTVKCTEEQADKLNKEQQELVNQALVTLDALRAASLKTSNKQTQAVLKLVEQAFAGTLPSVPVVLRASVAMAGVYARVDRERGVWKAPANVGVAGVTALVVQGESKSVSPRGGGSSSGGDESKKTATTIANTPWHNPVPVRIDDALNTKLIDKHINAIRVFRGQGVMVWGARTQEDNDLWRYIPVRRLFNTLERDARTALQAAVFEPNSPLTWEQVRGGLDHYLNALWRKGALQGETPEQAYYVQIGLGATMTQDDINQGRMIVRIGVAAVRPAEFIVLQLTQNVIAS
ncbi:phage tail sheath C-terminal domain-containing protein (plasmid) [Serratia marcescens]|uniref:phage tail sheath family protein n=1 Tax=Serratia marcescens TaxID=615 RepID=UPI0025700C8B|nr:phage tail sheath C-terminal domain-containing protein [Serratia marcescens]WJD90518.1 phage tail sheath C-terminal domain-containing protein [Serratia marcescens]